MVKSESSFSTNLSHSIDELLRSDYVHKKKVVEKKKKSIVEKFMEKKDNPSWYLALSSSQLTAADSLLDNIRDDTEQGTAHRCRLALLRLGLFPLESARNIKLALKLSKGNDLAFLWFLMNLFYKDTCDKCTHPKIEYNVNEQIIMSVIAHLDMVTTLRELDKILPEQPKLPKGKPPKRKKLPKQDYVLPYLQPLPRPKIITSKINSSPALKPYNLDRRYKIYKDPNYVVRNEANRWYALPEEVQEDLDFGFNIHAQATKIVDKILEDQIKAIFSEDFDKGKVFSALCTKHKKLKEIEEHLNNVLQVAIRERTKSHFNLGSRKKVGRKKAAERLERSAREYREECDQEVQQMEMRTWVRKLIDELIYDTTEKLEAQKEKCSTSHPCRVNRDNLTTCGRHPQCDCYCTLGEDALDFGHFGTPKPCEIFFRAPGKNRPYKFYYEKIFKDELSEKNDPIKAAVNNALELENYVDEDEAIDSWLKGSWQTEVKIFNEEYEKKLRSEVDKKNLERYDPRNSKLMESMLLNAIKEMRKDPKFVFASLPNAHKHPVLKEWMKQRYGYVLTAKERKAALILSKKILEFTRRRKCPLKVPRQETVAVEKVVSYVCRNYLYEKSKHILATFFHNLKMYLLENVKVYWMAMEPTHIPRNSFVDTFYAYMPSRVYDILPFKPWKDNEYMEAAKEWENRVKKRKFEEKQKI